MATNNDIQHRLKLIKFFYFSKRSINKTYNKYQQYFVTFNNRSFIRIEKHNEFSSYWAAILISEGFSITYKE